MAVLGGGMGALAAAWQLVRLDPDRYDITVYPRGWRLGGKGASGRNREPGKGLRIEEHGLHILMGFYDNVFHILRTCYDELGPAAGVGTWSEALAGSDHLHVCDRYRDGQAEIWELQLPVNSHELPGAQPPEDPDVAAWIRSGLGIIYQILKAEGGAPPWLDWLGRTLVQRQSDSARLRSDLLGEATRASIRGALTWLFHRLGDPERRDPLTVVRRRQVMIAYFVGANLLGILNAGLWSKEDFLRAAGALDALDYRDWLRHSGGRIGARWPELSWDSALVQAVYDLVFSGRGDFGAGTALHGTLRMLLGYRSQAYYRMNGGMGDVAFAPLYLWLRRQGVRFRFFSRVRKLGVGSSGGGRVVDEITVEDQVDLAGQAYDPLFEARGRLCWPSAPLSERLPPGARRRLEQSGADLEAGAGTTGALRSLRRGRDFDVAVLGIPVGVFQDEPEMTAELAEAHPPFAEMVQGIRTVPTRAFQIWTDRDAPGLGWRGRPGMLGAFQGPFVSWADMSQVIEREAWEDSDAVRGVHYFCGVQEPSPPAAAGAAEGASGETVRQEAIQWLESALRGLLPAWSWDHLCGGGGHGPERFAAQYWRANVAASDRYVLAAPGTLRFRLPPDGSGFDNLYLAGDWVKTELNAGCLEAAAMAGVAAARAIHRRADQHLVPVSAQSYVDRDSDWVLRAPVEARDVTSALFVLHADPEALAELCRAQVERPTGGAVTARPWPARAGLVLLLCADLPHVQSGDDQHRQVGFFHEHDVGFLVPVTLSGRTGPAEIGLLTPYLFVDSAIGLQAGREIYGFSKLFARIDMPVPLPGRGFALPPEVTVVADVLARISPAARAGGAIQQIEQATVLELIPGRSRASALHAPGERRLLPLLRQALPALGLRVPMLFLKQFRDTGAPALACHQSLVRCGARAVLAGTPRPLRGSFLVRLPPHDKPDLAGTLGLPAELETRLAFQVEHDLLLPAGRQLWP